MRKLHLILFMFVMVIIMGYAGCGNEDGDPTPHELQYPPPTQEELQEFQTQPQMGSPETN